MKRTTIFVPEALERDLKLYARRERKPTASIVREAIAEYIARRPAHPLPSFVGAFDSGLTDTAARHEALVFGAVTPHGDDGVTYRRPSRKTPRRRRR
jgi:predicted transcriptional regulator